jgi:type III restriction enzyme
MKRFRNTVSRSKKNLLRSCFRKGTKKIPIKNGDEEPVENGAHSYISEEHFAKLLRELSKRMSKRTMYQINLDSTAFIEACSSELNEKLRYQAGKE